MTEHPRFTPATLSLNESERLAALHRLEILDSPLEEAFDELAALAALVCNTPIALVSLVDENRQWFKARCGIEAAETGRDESFCAHAILGDSIFEVPNTLEDDRFADNPLVTQAPEIRFYAGAPLLGSTGHNYGTLCVIDTQPGELSDTQRAALTRMARLVVIQLEARLERLQDLTKANTLEILLEQIPDAVVSCRNGENDHQFNNQGRLWLGMDPRTLPKDQWGEKFQLYQADGETPLPRDQIPLLRALRGEVINQVEMVIKARNQPPRVVLCNGVQLKDTDGEPIGALVVMHDITELKNANQRLQRESFHLSTVLEGTHAGTWEWNIQTGETLCNERWAGMLGYTLAELEPMHINGWFDLIHPDDLVASQSIREKHFTGETPFFDFILRMRHKLGHWVWIHSRGQVYQWDVDGKPLAMAGTHLDVTAVKEVEAEIQSARSYLQEVIDASRDVAIIATDTDGLITLFNPGAEHLLGYQQEELVGIQTPAIFHRAEEMISRGQELSAREGREISGFDVFVSDAYKGNTETRQWTYIRKDGRNRQVSLSVSALHDGEGNTIGFLGMAIDQTERFAAEEAARLAAERFSGAFNSAAAGMALVSVNGQWLEVNDALCDMLKYSREELLHENFQILTHPDDMDTDLFYLDDLLTGKIPNYQLEKRYYCKDGSLIWAKLWISLVRDSAGQPLHFVSQVRNITEETLARQALQSSEMRLRGLFELSPIGIALNDLETGKFIDLNDALIAPTGYTKEEFVQLSYWDITPQEYAVQEQQAIEKLQATGRYGPFEKEYIRKDGTRYPVVLQGILMTDANGHEVIWSLVEDISERKRLMRLKNEFVSTVSHELRTPLTSISGALGLIVGGALGEVPGEMQEMLQIAADNSKRLGQLVNDLLDMDKLLAGKMELKIQSVELQPLLNDTLISMQAYADSFRVKLEHTGSEPIRLHIDPDRLTQVLTNLLSNACKHSPPGAQVELHHESGPENSVIISVIDHGTGIPQAFRPRIFQKFAQADGSDSRSKGGTGLGLAICKELIEHMGGVIGYESEEGKGSHFWMRLPRAKSQKPLATEGLRILHIEDDRDFARVISLQLEKIAQTLHAPNLETANAMLRQQQFDLILLDLNLPDGHGQAIWESVHLSQPGVPIVILSGHEVPRALASQVASVLAKGSFTPELLISTLQDIFSPGERPQ